MTWSDLQAFLSGKRFLIGLTFLDQEEQVLEKYQTHGTVDVLTDEGVFHFIREDGSLFKMPYDPETILKPPPGDYREHSTGKVIKDPDFIMSWEIVVPAGQTFEEVKQVGFVAPSV
ncbi:MAG: hypothetical protein EAZ89_05865 [Bacteroidetes bacterium]|nr:MAG: hypothetical protein EAZ89_05865 [Bacteroidota bacterium]